MLNIGQRRLRLLLPAHRLQEQVQRRVRTAAAATTTTMIMTMMVRVRMTIMIARDDVNSEDDERG